MRAIVSTISTIIYLVAVTPCMPAMAETPSHSTKSQVAAMSAGTIIEIQLKDQSKVMGKLGRVTGDRFELEVEQAGKVRITNFLISDITSVRRPLPTGSDLELSASALGAVVLDAKIKLMTREGTYVEGKVLQATEEKLLMEVSKSEPKGRLRGREAEIRTADIAVVYMKKNGSIVAPVALGVVGGFLGALGTSYAAWRTCSTGAGAAAFVIAGMAGGATAGAYAGHEAVKKTVTINVVPAR